MASFRFVASGEFVKSCGTAKEALRFGATMLFTPVTGLLELYDQRFVTLGTLFLGHTVLDAPPAAMTMIYVGYHR